MNMIQGTITLKIYDSVLPQDDHNIVQRKQELEDKRKLYEFAQTYEGAMPLVKDNPPDEEFSDADKDKFNGLRVKYKFEVLKTLICSKKWECFTDFRNVFGKHFFITPDHPWTEDSAFGARALMGANPILIRLCKSIPENFAVTNDMLQPIMNMTIQEAIDKKKLFIINLAHLAGLPCIKEENKEKICSPIALFYLDKDDELLPAAIQLRHKPSKDNPVFLPTDPEFTWLNAKLWFSNADAIEHQSATHLALTHFLIGSVSVALNRSLSPSHPMFRFLVPHFFNVLAINAHGGKVLLTDDGWFNKILPCGMAGVRVNVKQAWQNYRLDVQGNLPNDLKHRGVDDPEVLPDYYYRDDGMLYWNAIKKYVTLVVEGHYGNVEKLKEDPEIQDFANVLVNECGMQGVPGDGMFTTCQQLIDTMTSFIHISSVLHAAVNSPQYDYYSSPFASIRLRGTPPTDKTPLDEKHVMATLGDKIMILENMVLFIILSTNGSNRLGAPEMEYQFDVIGKNAEHAFRNDLRELERIIEERSKTRTYSYKYLHPKEVTNSIGI